MQYLVTWYEGDDINYLIVPADGLPEIIEEDKSYIVVPLVA